MVLFTFWWPSHQNHSEQALFLMLEEHHQNSWAGAYQPPDQAFIDACQNLFSRTFKNPAAPELVGDWHRVGFELKQHMNVWMLIDKKKRGLGFYVFGSDPGKLCLQAPHSRYDRFTGEIALRLFGEHELGALAMNSCHRYKAAEAPGSSDMAHVEDSVFQAFTRARAISFEDTPIIQLHGYTKNKRKSAAASALDFIVSTGSKRHFAGAARVVRELALIDLKAGVYGRDVFELGGTKNQQLRVLQALGFTRFLHVEMSAEARKELVADSKKRSVLLEALN